MNDVVAHITLSTEEHAQSMSTYIEDGERRAHELGNRGPIRFDVDGNLESRIIDAYRGNRL